MGDRLAFPQEELAHGEGGRKKLSMKLEVNRTEINENAAGKRFENSSLTLFCVETHPTELLSSPILSRDVEVSK